jgi:uncharacterized protein (DUF1800 family)
MEISRRDLIRLSALGLGGVAGSGCGPLVRRVGGRTVPQNAMVPMRGGSEAHRFLNRSGFGASPGDHQAYLNLGREAYVEAQLNPTDEDELALQVQMSRLDVNRVHAAELRELPEGEVMRQLRQAAILRAVYSKWQVRERMIDFWTNHLNIFAVRGDNAYRKGMDDMQVIRANALGSFPKMIEASAKSAAMLGYLDNRLNRKGVPNENYARELLELHTLGVNGGYSQRDVQEVARCFTGWTIEKRFLKPKDQFRFDPEAHDDGQKNVLGKTIPQGGGVLDGERVIEILTSHPSCAAFLAKKLCRYFLGTGHSEMEIIVATEFLRTKGNIAATIRPILLSDAILSGEPVIKRPFDFTVSALRSLNFTTDGGPSIHAHLDAMGQPLYGWAMPDGYPDGTAAWTGSILARWNFVWALSQGEIKGTELDLNPVAGKVRDFTLGVTGGGGETLADIAFALSAPEFNWR